MMDLSIPSGFAEARTFWYVAVSRMETVASVGGVVLSFEGDFVGEVVLSSEGDFVGEVVDFSGVCVSFAEVSFPPSGTVVEVEVVVSKDAGRLAVLEGFVGEL